MQHTRILFIIDIWMGQLNTNKPVCGLKDHLKIDYIWGSLSIAYNHQLFTYPSSSEFIVCKQCIIWGDNMRCKNNLTLAH